MGNAVDSGYSVPTLEVTPASAPGRHGVALWWLLFAVLAGALSGLFVFSDVITRDWADSDLLLALAVMWLAGLTWRGLRGG